MLKPKKKISKKEIKQDKLVTRFMQVETWTLDNQKLLTYVGLGVAAVILIVFVWSDRLSTMESEGASRLGAILPVYNNGDMQQAIDGVPARGTFGLRSIVEEYGSTDAGNLAKLLLSNALLSQDKPEEALGYLEDIDPPSRLMESAVLSARGVALEKLGEHEDAARFFERAVSTDPTNPLSSERLVQAAANFAKSGERDRAGDVLKTLKKQYPQSAAAREVERYMAEFAS